MTNHAHGEFHVQINPQAQDEGAGSTLGRMSLDKTFEGDLSGTGKGEMLTVMTPSSSAVYAAIERVTGTLHGRSGGFALVHQGIATPQGQTLTIIVAPDSGSGELVGLTGTMEINIADGKHSYDLHYTLP